MKNIGYKQEACSSLKFTETLRSKEQKERLIQQLELLEHVGKVAQQMGLLSDVRILGGVAYPELRDHRDHGDDDVMVLGRKSHDVLKTALVSGVGGVCFQAHALLPLKGSCMSYLHADEFNTAGPVELRFVEPTQVNGVLVATHGVPFWVKPFLQGHKLIIPMSAFSHPSPFLSNQTIQIGSIDFPYVYHEYSYLVKKSSKYPKDIADCQILEAAGLNMLRLRQIQRDIKASGASFLLPHQLMQIIRSFPIYGLSQEQYAKLVAVPVKSKANCS